MDRGPAVEMTKRQTWRIRRHFNELGVYNLDHRLDIVNGIIAKKLIGLIHLSKDDATTVITELDLRCKRQRQHLRQVIYAARINLNSTEKEQG